MKTLVLSDLHLGPDHVMPIYAGGDALPALILEHATQPLRVVLNGDTFDLLLDDEPLALDAAVAARRARACAESCDGKPLMLALAKVLQRGGEVIIRAGNHDLELALGQVQGELADVLGRAGAPLARLSFADDDKPYLFEDHDLRVAIAHGENTDPFNRWSREELGGDFTYPPGSVLVKSSLNALKHELRFIDLLKPDFQGAVLSALAVKPSAVRHLLKLSTLDIIANAVARSFGQSSYSDELEVPFGRHVIGAELDDDEGDELLAFLESADASYADESEQRQPGLLSRALTKVGRSALGVYAAMHRTIGSDAGIRFFEEAPDDAEWKEAERLQTSLNANVVVMGHTHARRFANRNGLVYVNTGTWIVLMQLPAPDASIDEWRRFLDDLAADPHLENSSRTRLVGTACLIDGADAATQVRLLGDAGTPPQEWHTRAGVVARARSTR